MTFALFQAVNCAANVPTPPKDPVTKDGPAPTGPSLKAVRCQFRCRGPEARPDLATFLRLCLGEPARGLAETGLSGSSQS